MKALFATAAILGLAACLLSPILYFVGAFSEPAFKLVFLVASIAWFVFAWLWRREAEARGAVERGPGSA